MTVIAYMWIMAGICGGVAALVKAPECALLAAAFGGAALYFG